MQCSKEHWAVATLVPGVSWLSATGRGQLEPQWALTVQGTACLLHATGADLQVNTALWNSIQMLFPAHAAEAPPPTPDARQLPPAPQQQQAARGRTSRRAAAANEARHLHVANILAGAGEARQQFRAPR
jgi:hypothetical protein